MAISLGVNAYVTVENFKAWASLRRYDLTSFLSSTIEGAIAVATLDFIDVNYDFKGSPASNAQVLKLPTDEVTIEDVEAAVCQTVYQYLKGDLFVDLSEVENQEVVSKSDSLGDLSTSKTYREGSQKTYVKSTQNIDRMFAPFVTIGNGGLRILRG